MSAPPPPLPTHSPTQFPCRQCGAGLEFAPGTTALKCPYCGTDNVIEVESRLPRENDFEAELARISASATTAEELSVKCSSCAAESRLAANQTAGLCPFCGTALVAQASSRRCIKPQYLLPFKVSGDQSMTLFRRWIAGLWFAPSNLKTYADRGGLQGIYTPAWTYDFNTHTRYTGQRGDDYWTTESYTTTVNGRSVRQTRQVKRTRWTSVSGAVSDEFDDLLVMASKSLPADCLSHLEPWDLPALTPYRDEFLAGFVAESYQVDLREGFGVAQQLAEPAIQQHIRRDIGGDHQRIADMQPRYSAITYKHILLPVWLSSYRYHNKVYRFLVNARTGEIRGQRPYSAWKITFLVLAILAAVLIGVALMSGR
jgi:predicted RNA-binding Zn-ribbon protein involved in translation (DUF1610 family)